MMNKNIKKKLYRIPKIIILSMFFCGILMALISDNVNAAPPFILVDWENFNIGVSSGSDAFISWERELGDHFTIANHDDWNTDDGGANAKTLHLRDNGQLDRGWINLTQDYPYIHNVSFKFEIDTGNGNDNLNMYFYNDGTQVLKLRIVDLVGDGGGEKIQYFDVNNVGHTLLEDADLPGVLTKFVISVTHLAGNTMNYSIFDNTQSYINGADDSSRSVSDWTTFDSIYITTSANNGIEHFYLDDIGLNTTWSGFEGDPPAGFLGVNTYDELTGNNVTNFYFLAVNTVGDTFYDYNLSNTFIVPGVSLPQGNVTITIGATNYYSRSFVMEIHSGYFYIDGVPYANATINAYLPHINFSFLYHIQVIDEYLYPVDRARLLIQGLVADNTTLIDISDTYTDGYGETQVYLIPGRQYIVTISKDGFNTLTETWIPSSTDFSKVFRINRTFNVNDTYEFWDLCNFHGTMFLNNTIRVNYSTNSGNTTNARFYTYELYNFTRTLRSTDDTTNNSYTFWVENINSSRLHQVTIYLNHTILGFEVHTITISPINITRFTGIEKTFRDVFGHFDLGYVNTFLIYIPAIVILILPGVYNPGIGIIGCGLYLGGVSQFLIVPSQIMIIVPFIVIVGILLMIIKGGRNRL